MAIVVEEKGRKRERTSERERKRKERERERGREQRMQQIFSECMCLHAAVLRVCRHCTDRDINFTEEREHTHMHAKEKMREQGSRFFFLVEVFSSLAFFLLVCVYMIIFYMYR